MKEMIITHMCRLKNVGQGGAPIWSGTWASSLAPSCEYIHTYMQNASLERILVGIDTKNFIMTSGARCRGGELLTRHPSGLCNCRSPRPCCRLPGGALLHAAARVSYSMKRYNEGVDEVVSLDDNLEADETD